MPSSSFMQFHTELFRNIREQIAHFGDIVAQEGLLKGSIRGFFPSHGGVQKPSVASPLSRIEQQSRIWRHEVLKEGSPLNRTFISYVELFDRRTRAMRDNPMDWDRTGHLPHEKLRLGWDGFMMGISNLPMPEPHRRRSDQKYVYSKAVVKGSDGRTAERDVIGISIGRCSSNMDATLERMLRRAMDRNLFIPPRPDGKPWQRDMRIPAGAEGNTERNILGNALCRRHDSPFLAAHKLAPNSEIMLNDRTAVLAAAVHRNLSSENLAQSFSKWKRGRVLKINQELSSRIGADFNEREKALQRERKILLDSFQFGSLQQFMLREPPKNTDRAIEKRPDFAPSGSPEHERSEARRRRHVSSGPVFSRLEGSHPPARMQRSMSGRSAGKMMTGQVRSTKEIIGPSEREEMHIDGLLERGLSLSEKNVSFRLDREGNLFSVLSLTSSERQAFGLGRSDTVAGSRTIDMKKLPSGTYRMLNLEKMDYAGELSISNSGIISVGNRPAGSVSPNAAVMTHIRGLNEERKLERQQKMDIPFRERKAERGPVSSPDDPGMKNF